MTRSLILVFLFVLSQSWFVFANDNVVYLQQISSSGRTLYIDRGSVDGVQDEEYGVLMTKKEISLGKFVYKPVAKIRSIKTLNRQSVWVAYRVFIPSELVRGNRLMLLSETNLLKGRTELTVKRTSVVTRKNPSAEVKDFLLEGDSLAKKKDEYKVINKNVIKKEPHQNKLIDLVDVEAFEDKYGDGRLYVSGIYKSPMAEEFVDRKRVHTFEKMVVAFFKKFNDPNFDEKEFYGSEGPQGDSDINIYRNYEKDVLANVNRRKKLYERLRKKGSRWSSKYSDDELSDILGALDADYEFERRRTLLAYKFKYQGYVSFGLNLINNDNINDPETTEQSRFDVEVAAESYFFKKFEELKNFTGEVSLRRAKDSFFGGELNARSTEYSVAGHINWYPFRRPSTIGANIVYFGVLMRYGLSFLTNVTNDEQGNYQVFTLPGFRGGLKYNFTNKFGFRVTAGFEQIRVERLVRNNDIGTLPDRTRYYEGKLAVGLSKFF